LVTGNLLYAEGVAVGVSRGADTGDVPPPGDAEGSDAEGPSGPSA
jgi:hypothetical protein